MAGTKSKKRKKNLRRRKKDSQALLLLSAGVMGTLAIVYIGIAIFFGSHFTWGTTLNGLSVGGKSASEVEELLQREVGRYGLTILEREDKKEKITGSDIGMELKLDGEVKKLIKEQNGFLWIGDIFKKPELTLTKSTSYDKAALEETVERLGAMEEDNQRMPADATYSRYTKSGYVLVPADYGTVLIKERVIAAVEEAVENWEESVDLDAYGCYLEPEITDDNEALLQLIETLNTYTATEIHYQFGSSTEVLNGNQISEWLLVDEEMNVTVDRDAVLDYVKKLAREYNTAYYSKKLLTSYGVEVTVPSGPYGWRIDNGSERDQIIEDIATGEKIEREPAYFTRANSHDGNDYGDSYVEINLTAQHLFLYVDGELIVESDFVSGCVAKGYMTPGGAFPITYITKDATLRGEDYETPVNYWMPFNGNIGMHDLTSRKAFGSDIYVTNGSHGCINLPYEAAQTIYEHVEKGFPVLVYNLPGSESETVKARNVSRLISYIDGIGQVTELSGTPIKAARYLYDNLESAQKIQITNYPTLVAAEEAFAIIEAQQAAENAAQP